MYVIIYTHMVDILEEGGEAGRAMAEVVHEPRHDEEHDRGAEAVPHRAQKSHRH